MADILINKFSDEKNSIYVFGKYSTAVVKRRRGKIRVSSCFILYSLLGAKPLANMIPDVHSIN